MCALCASGNLRVSRLARRARVVGPTDSADTPFVTPLPATRERPSPAPVNEAPRSGVQEGGGHRRSRASKGAVRRAFDTGLRSSRDVARLATASTPEIPRDFPPGSRSRGGSQRFKSVRVLETARRCGVGREPALVVVVLVARAGTDPGASGPRRTRGIRPPVPFDHAPGLCAAGRSARTTGGRARRPCCPSPA